MGNAVRRRVPPALRLGSAGLLGVTRKPSASHRVRIDVALRRSSLFAEHALRPVSQRIKANRAGTEGHRIKWHLVVRGLACGTGGSAGHREGAVGRWVTVRAVMLRDTAPAEIVAVNSSAITRIEPCSASCHVCAPYLRLRPVRGASAGNDSFGPTERRARFASRRPATKDCIPSARLPQLWRNGSAFLGSPPL